MSIQVRNIHKSFGSFTALGDVSLDFPTGELTALLGPSGCGKTTLLRIIAGLETADRGQVLLDGADASDTHVREREVGFVFQHYALFRHMTVFDNVAFGLRVKPRKQRPPESEIKRKVHELLQLVQLDWLADRYPPQLSGGQRQRIALARALAVEPRVLLLDEPFGALDAKVRKELRRWLRRLHDELHITSIFVTHDQEEALEVADRVVLMDHGRVEQVGSPTEVYQRPATPFVYGFLGAVNRFEGRVDSGIVRVGDQTLAQGAGAAIEGAQQGLVQAYARPHELVIIPAQDAPGLPATVERVLAFGAAARVELRGASGEHLEAELSREQAEALQLASGQRVRLQASRLSLFGIDQAA
ncbi:MULTISPECIES: sulfate/molybdate ABC transporter ATP-binding protein [unclassified Roseateles]|uniref:sulfate/molybdate ABC transporter ATP-binding protein n=1 Tax=unclassified Roseateles TaxID=2626991 RepID=UPI00162038E6|nr:MULTISPECIES: sulfate ABC transporter ATP-binding protein [unclassified Roseateles]MBB3283833.1 sulfate transport system ATP-binding protein [Mitsuaria sp. BK037]MBB3295873.1 sulfate transport system ATP-binding protein [Mitsuaria sp. BK041]MBB3365089.1 sulfate transport system ATP-binding protein [Mitsuaria sp. BK045]